MFVPQIEFSKGDEPSKIDSMYLTNYEVHFSDTYNVRICAGIITRRRTWGDAFRQRALWRKLREHRWLP